MRRGRDEGVILVASNDNDHRENRCLFFFSSSQISLVLLRMMNIKSALACLDTRLVRSFGGIIRLRSPELQKMPKEKKGHLPGKLPLRESCLVTAVLTSATFARQTLTKCISGFRTSDGSPASHRTISIRSIFEAIYLPYSQASRGVRSDKHFM